MGVSGDTRNTGKDLRSDADRKEGKKTGAKEKFKPTRQGKQIHVFRVDSNPENHSDICDVMRTVTAN